MKYKTQSLIKYLNDLAARLPTPGGGSAAALNAALAASLVSMVINFTLGKPKYLKYEAELKVVLNKSEKLRNDFLELVDLDVIAFQSKDPRKAFDVALMLARLSCEGMKLLPLLIKKTNLNLISDLAIAAIFFESAFSAAGFNVEINLKVINDHKFTQMVNKELLVNAKLVKQTRFMLEEKIGKIIRG